MAQPPETLNQANHCRCLPLTERCWGDRGHVDVFPDGAGCNLLQSVEVNLRFGRPIGDQVTLFETQARRNLVDWLGRSGLGNVQVRWDRRGH